MAVYTEVSEEEAHTLLHRLNLGKLSALQACAGGIENTNYFVSAERDGQQHSYVLTLFERLTFEQLPFYLRLMCHLAQRGLPVPVVQASPDGELVQRVKGKPAALVTRLPGHSVAVPQAAHCAQVAAALARLHLAGRDFEPSQPHGHALPWCHATAAQVLPFLNDRQKALLQQELAFQNHLVASSSYAALPRGIIHADLFRDNVLFETLADAPHLSGLFDFYFAGQDAWVFDLAVSLNDWCFDPLAPVAYTLPAHQFIASYSAVRPLQAAERELLPSMLRAAALRFWISRLCDYHLPRQASLLSAHDPSHFEQVLHRCATEPLAFEALAGHS